MSGVSRVAAMWADSLRSEWTLTVVRNEPAPVMGRLAELDDRALAELSAGGRREAFDLIVARHRRSVYRLCYRFAGNPEDASDLSQEVFLRAYRGLGRFKGRSSLSTWLYRIGVNVCLNRPAGKRRLETVLNEDRVDDRAPSPMADLLKSEEASRVRAAIRRLPRTQRATLILRVYHELSHQEIAKVLDSSVGTVKVNFFHALKSLRKILSRP